MITYFKNAFIGGLMILIPIVVLYITLRELLDIMVGIATPIAELFPENTFDNENKTEIIAIVMIVLTSVVLGALATIGPVRSLGRWFESVTLHRIPMYRMLKSLIAAFLDLEGEKAFAPAVLTTPGGVLEPVYVIEDLGKDTVVVMQPWTPTPFAGSVKVVPKKQIEKVPVTLDEFSLALTHFGLGLTKLLDKMEHTKNGGNQEPAT